MLYRPMSCRTYLGAGAVASAGGRETLLQGHIAVERRTGARRAEGTPRTALVEELIHGGFVGEVRVGGGVGLDGDRRIGQPGGLEVENARRCAHVASYSLA